MKKKIFIVLGLTVSIATVLFFTKGYRKSVKVKLINPKEKTLEKTINATGFLDKNNTLKLSFTTSGTLKNILVKEGDKVKKGQPLAYLNSYSLYNKIQALKKTIDQIALQKKIYIETYQNNLEGAGGRERYELNLKEYDKKIEKAKLDYLASSADLNNYSIFAPNSGTILKVYKKQGESINTGEPILLLQGSGDLFFNALIDEEDLGYLKMQDDALITLDAVPNKNYNAKVFYISNFINKDSKTAEVHLQFNKNHNELLYGMSGEAEIKVDQFKAKNALRFDQVFTDEAGNSYIWIVQNQKVKKFPVDIVYEGNLYVALKQDLKGLKIVEPLDTKKTLKEGLRVKIVNNE